jgi:hypothetical protein
VADALEHGEIRAMARDQRTGLEVFAEYGDASRPALSANYGWADEEAVDDDLGPWLRQVDADGDMVLASYLSASEIVPVDPAGPTGLRTPERDTPVLLVNDTYLAEEEVLSPSGDRYGSDERVRILLPESSAGLSEQLTDTKFAL